MGRTVGEGVCFQGIEYSALPSQDRFHKSTARFKGFSGPVGSGKSQALCQEAIRLSYLNPGRSGLLGAPTYPMLRDATQATLFDILNKSKIPHEHHKAENVLVLKDTGSKIIFRPVDDYERLRGTNLAWFGLDELTYTAEAAWLRLEGRLRDPQASRLCGFAVWTPKGFDWVYRRFIENPVDGYEVVKAQPYENRFLLGKVPDYYERLKRSYDERFFEQEVLGKYLNVHDGLVYFSFDRARNVAEVELEGRWPLLWALDFNVDPLCSVVAQIQDGMLNVVEEIVLRRANTYQACEQFLDLHPQHATGVWLYGDCSGTKSQTTGKTDFAIIREALYRARYPSVIYKVPTTNPGVRDRVSLVNGLLRSADGGSRVRIHPRCKELIADLEQVSYKPDSGVIDKEKDHMRTHLSDAMGYLIWQEFQPRERAGYKTRRLV